MNEHGAVGGDVPSPNYAALLPVVQGARKRIQSASVDRPPRFAERVALMGLLSKPGQRAQLLERFGEWDSEFSDYLPFMLAMKRRALRRDVIDQSWHHARVTAPRSYTLPPQQYRTPPLPRAQECWALLQIAGEAVHDILHLGVWTDRQTLDEHGLRVDLATSLHHIGSQLLDSARLANELGEMPTGNSAESIHTRSIIEQQTTGLDIVRESVAGHINALRTYRDRLTAVDEQTELVRRADRASRVDDQVAELVQRSGGADIPATDLSDAASSLSDATRARSKALADVRGDYLHALDMH